VTPESSRTTVKPPLISLESVHRQWGDRSALTDVSLTIEAGQRVALIGPSGSGKSTLLRLVCGALASSRGTVRIDGEAIQALSVSRLQAHRARCGIVEQSQHLVPQLSVHRNVVAGLLPQWAWYRTLFSLGWPLERDRVAALLDSLGIVDRQWDKARVLSVGQQQRVAIARGLVGNPAIILADEPTASLDPTTAAEAIQLLVDQAESRSATLLLCSHQLSQVVHSVDRVVGLREGRVVIDEAPDRVTDAMLNVLYEGSRERR